jgi:antimicrobial peptide system SdpA family protein
MAAAVLGAMTITAIPQLLSAGPEWTQGLRHAYVIVWPQGWAFFADAPRKDTLIVYQVDQDTEAITLLTHPMMSQENVWGLSRREDGRQVEARQIANKIPEPIWRACKTYAMRACTTSLMAAPAYAVVNHSPQPGLCGLIILALERPRSWSSADGRDFGKREVVKAATARVECTADD